MLKYSFYSPTCSHCQAEKLFLESLEQKYPELEVKRYLASDLKNQILLRQLLEAADALNYFDSVPIMFIGDELFLGFDTVDGEAVCMAPRSAVHDGVSHEIS